MVLAKKIVLTTSISLLGSEIGAWNIAKFDKIPHATSLLTGTALLSTGWVIKEWYQRASQKNDLESQLYQQRVQADKYIEKLTDEMKALQEDEYFLVEKTQYFENFQKVYAPQISILSKETLTSNDIQTLLEFFETYVRKTATSFDSFEEMLQKELSELEGHCKQLNEKVNEWQVKQSLYLHIKGQELLTSSTSSILFLRRLIQIGKQQKGFLSLKALVTPEYSIRYTFEREALKDERVLGSLNKRVALLYAEEKFPYVAYEQELERESIHLEKVLSYVKTMHPTDFQQQLIEHSYELYRALKMVRTYVHDTSHYKEQQFLLEWSNMRRQIAQIEKQVASNETLFQKELGNLQSQYQALSATLEQSTKAQNGIQSLCSELSSKVRSLQYDIHSLQAQQYIFNIRK